MKIINNYTFVIIIETIFLISGKENAVLKVVQDFGKLQNVTSITCGTLENINLRPITVTKTWNMWLFQFKQQYLLCAHSKCDC